MVLEATGEGKGNGTEGRGENKRQTPNNNAGGNRQETKDKIQK
jgi:hypothetical protein